jgi:hypothetical protein
MGNEKLLARVGEGAEATTRASLGLMAETLAKEIRMVEQLCRTMAKPTRIAARANTLIVELLVARLRTIQAFTFR